MSVDDVPGVELDHYKKVARNAEVKRAYWVAIDPSDIIHMIEEIERRRTAKVCEDCSGTGEVEFMIRGNWESCTECEDGITYNG